MAASRQDRGGSAGTGTEALPALIPVETYRAEEAAKEARRAQQRRVRLAVAAVCVLSVVVGVGWMRMGVETYDYRVESIAESYRLLGVSPDMGTDAIRRVYRKLMREFHPDSTHHPRDFAERRYIEITRAFRNIDAFRTGAGVIEDVQFDSDRAAAPVTPPPPHRSRSRSRSRSRRSSS